MHEATVTIKKLWSPFKVGDKRTNLDDTEGNKYRIEVTTAAGFHDGDVVSVGYTKEEFGGKSYKLIKQMKLAGPDSGGVALPPKPNGVAPKAADVGPHVGMWEKIVSDLLEKGMPEEAIPVHGITCRRLARKILQADIDGKLPELPDDDLENTF